MDKFVIEGGYPLSGQVVPAGNKNAALPILAASLLTEEEVVVGNVPRIRDVDSMLALLEDLGVSVSWRDEHELALRADNVTSRDVDEELASRIRASFLLAGPLVARFGEARMPPPGGDVIGRRRLDPHLDALSALGAEIEADTAATRCAAPAGLRGLRHLHGRGERDGDGERADGRRADAGHDDDPQRRVGAPRAGSRPAAGSDGRSRSTGIGSNVLVDPRPRRSGAPTT